MIDFHTHILPGIDDGSRSIEESVAMLHAEAEQGIDTVFLTPHYYANQNSPAVFLQRREAAWERLEPYLMEDMPQIRLGAEVQYFEGICTVEDIQLLKIEGTDLLLLEMPFFRWSDRMVEDVLALNETRDTRVVLAHIERYLPMQSKEVWNDLRDCGILMQANVSFFTNWKTRMKAMSMLSGGQIHMLGSDCHNMHSRQPNWEKLPTKVWEKIDQSMVAEAFRKERDRFPEEEPFFQEPEEIPADAEFEEDAEFLSRMDLLKQINFSGTAAKEAFPEMELYAEEDDSDINRFWEELVAEGSQ